MKIRLFLLVSVLSLLILSCMSMTMESVSSSFPGGNPPGNAEVIIKNQDIIKIDTVAFEAKDLLGIRQMSGREIARYQRIPNPNYSVFSAKVFDAGGKELYILVPTVDQFGVHVHIKNSIGAQGNVDLSAKPEFGGFGSMTVKFTINTDFFNQPYKFHFYEKNVMTASFSPDQKTNSQYILFYEGRPVLACVSRFDLSHPENNKVNYLADREFFINKEEDLAAWSVIFMLVQDVNAQMAAENRQRNPQRSFMTNEPHETFPGSGRNNPPDVPPVRRWNNDGSLDNNYNPFDSF